MSKTVSKIDINYDNIKQRKPVRFELPDDSELTCNGCIDVKECEFAYDPYNTNGDCLALK